MNHCQVGSKIKRSEMPPDRHCVKTKWVLKIKKNCILHARLVDCGYSQIAGVYYTAKYAPVINDVTWHVLLIVMLLKKYDGNILDIEVAFLHGDLGEENYMDCLQVLEYAKEDKCVKLLQKIYDIVQSSRQL